MAVDVLQCSFGNLEGFAGGDNAAVLCPFLFAEWALGSVGSAHGLSPFLAFGLYFRQVQNRNE